MNLTKLVATIALSAVTMPVFAAGHNAVVLKKALSGQKIDWTSGESYEGGLPPGSDDTIVIPDGMTALVDGDSVSFVGSRYRIQPAGRTAKLEVDIASDADWSASFTSYLPDYALAGFNRDYGVLVKKGAGTLSLKMPSRFAASGKNYDYLATLAVSNGVLKLPEEPGLTSTVNFYVQRMVVSAPGTIYGTGGAKLCTYVNEIWGDGLVTNVAGSAVFAVDGSSGGPSVFDGRLCLSTSLHLRYKADFGLTGTQNTFPLVYLYEASTLGLVSFAGAKGNPSPSGKCEAFYTYGNSTLRYIGTGGETTSKMVYNYTGTNIVDAGVGGITMSGSMYIMSGSTASVRPFIFSGDNETPAVFSGHIPDRVDNGAVYPPYLIKSGSGIWDFGKVWRNSFSGGVAVEEGVLRFGYLAGVGASGPLGVATNLYEEYDGAPDPSRRVDYAFRLGDERGEELTEGTLEYNGTSDVNVTDRLSVLKGDGCICNASEKNFRLRGVRALTPGLKTLALDGDSTAAVNVIEDVTDGTAGRVGVVKRGAGTWRIERNQGFTGPVEVEEGTLVLHNPDHATYFRFAVTENVGTTDETTWGNSWHSRARLQELALYDAAGNRVNTGISAVATSALKEKEGRMAQGSNVGISGVTTTIASLFDDGNADHGWAAGGNPTNSHLQVSDPASWPIVEFRLKEDVARVCSYDLVDSVSAGSAYMQCVPRGWKLWGSLDGKDWHELVSTNNAAVGPWYNKWYSDRTAFESGARRTGMPVDTALESGFSRPDNDYVRVAKGAKLVAHGRFDVKGLKVDANGAGALEGATFAESGSLVLENVDLGAGDVELPGTYENANGLGNLANWSLKVNGRSRTSRRVVIKDGKIRLLAPGMILLFR